MNPEYGMQLKTDQWRDRREEIKRRDGYICQRCPSNHHERRLEVHHLYYRLGLAAWEYPDDALQTLCSVCHEKAHRTERIPLQDEDGSPLSARFSCRKCGGPGEIPEYRHYQNGICFRCWGSGIDMKRLFASKK